MVNSDFWLTSGWHLLDKDQTGCLVPTEDFMRAYFYRPEVAPIDESCEAEIALHKKLVESPFIKVEKIDLEAIKGKSEMLKYQNESKETVAN